MVINIELDYQQLYAKTKLVAKQMIQIIKQREEKSFKKYYN